MTNTDGLFNEIVAFCEANTNPANIQKYSRYFVEGYDAYGIDQKTMEKQRDAWIKQYRNVFTKDESFQLADRLMSTGRYELMSFAIWVVRLLTGVYDRKTFAILENWFDCYIINWAHSDMLSTDDLPRLYFNKCMSDEDLYSWAKAGSRWRRRACAVSMIKIIQRSMDIRTALEVIRPAMLDEEKVVHQGLGWFLREAWKLHPAEVEAFLVEYKDDCARLIIQYATEKMTSEQKARFKRDKK